MEKNDKTAVLNTEQTARENVFVETYAEDMARVIGDDREGLIKKIIHSEEENEATKNNLSPESKKNQLYMKIGIALMLLSVLILFFFLLKKDGQTVPVAEEFTPIIFHDESIFLETSGLTQEGIGEKVSAEVANTAVKPGGVEGIYLTQNNQAIGLRRFIALIEGSFAPGDNTLLISDNFLMGAVRTIPPPSTVEKETGFFILLRARSTADIFAPMRAWEKKMLSDLDDFIGVNLGSDTSYLFSKDFTDGIVDNKNARILTDNEGEIILMYIFADDNSVVITDSRSAAREVMLRLASAQIEK